jgi:ketosteroid isomerase-like protein
MHTAQSALQGFLKAFAQFQLDGMMAWWADDATAFFPAEHRRERLSGKAAVRAAFAQLIARQQAAGITQLSIHAEDLQEQESVDVSVITFHLRGEPFCRRTFVLRHSTHGWHIVHLHASNAPLISTGE